MVSVPEANTRRATVRAMEFVCLAAGQGTRFGDLGRYLQKCMYPVGLRPFLEHTLRAWLEGARVDPSRDRLTLVVGHHSAQVHAYFGSAFEGVPLRYVHQAEPLGTGHAIGVAVDGLPDETSEVLVWLADLYVGAATFRALLDHEAGAVATIARGADAESPRLRVTRRGDRLLRVWDGEGPWLDAGAWRVPLAVARGLRRVSAEQGEYRVLPNLQAFVDAGLDVGAVELAPWIHLGGVHPTPEANVRQVVRQLWEIDS